MPYQFLESRITKIIDETSTVKRFFFEVNSQEPYRFQAGQFVMLDLPISSKVTTRSYSIASAPEENNTFELCIVLKPDGLGTTYLWEHVQEGSLVKISKPLGKFTLPENIDRDICFICTGTGIAPFRAMLMNLQNTAKSYKNLHLVFGNRYERDILYRNELMDLQQKLPKLSFIPVLSREEVAGCRKGYVHEVYESLYADKRPAYFYICGWHEMLQEARHKLEAMGYDKQYIKFEAYD